MRNPIKDQTAIVGVATTEYSRGGRRSPALLASIACKDAIRDAGLTRDDIDGVCGSTVPAPEMISILGLPSVRWWCNPALPFSFQIVEAMNAVYAGACTSALVYHSTYRMPSRSRSAAADAFRRRAYDIGHATPFGPVIMSPDYPETANGPLGYAAWAARYLHETGESRECLGYIALNSRTNAAQNPHAVLRNSMMMDEYLSARLIRSPLSMLDMDLPVDGGDAFVITTAERARDLAHQPVLIHAATHGMTSRPVPDQAHGLHDTGREIAARSLWSKSDLTLQDFDICYPYDGFSIIALTWLEAVGYCDPGRAGEFLRANWDEPTNRIVINGRVPVNTHGGSLSEGGTQGAGHVREAVVQLRGAAGERQVPGASAALLALGGFLFNATALALRTAT